MAQETLGRETGNPKPGSSNSANSSADNLRKAMQQPPNQAGAPPKITQPQRSFSEPIKTPIKKDESANGGTGEPAKKDETANRGIGESAKPPETQVSTEPNFYGEFKTKEDLDKYLADMKVEKEQLSENLKMFNEFLPKLTESAPPAPVQAVKQPEPPVVVPEPKKPAGIPLNMLEMTAEEIDGMRALTPDEIEAGMGEKREPWHKVLAKYQKRVLDSLEPIILNAVERITEEKQKSFENKITTTTQQQRQQEETNRRVTALKQQFFAQENLDAKYKAFQNEQLWATAFDYANKVLIPQLGQKNPDGSPNMQNLAKLNYYASHPNDYYKYVMDNYIALWASANPGQVTPPPAAAAAAAAATEPPPPPASVSQVGAGSAPRKPNPNAKLSPMQKAIQASMQKVEEGAYNAFG